MNLVFFTHPDFLGSQSMPRFAKMLANGMIERKHTVEVWSAQPRMYKLPVPGPLKKWLGYIDQYILFPKQVKARLKNCPADTLFVFADQALGPWVPLVADRPNVIHCHDFLAQFSALGMITENPTRWSGIQYQKYIRDGYSKGRNFISVSKKTQSDLHQILKKVPPLSEVVYNGLNQSWVPLNSNEAKVVLKSKIDFDISDGYLLHVGGNQWYKNREGVIEIYNAWREISKVKLPLILIGSKPSPSLLQKQMGSPYKENIHFLIGVDDSTVNCAYAGATVFLFPSLAEGFGWPIAEAMASGTPVITTNEAPMTEVAANAAFLIPKRPENIDAIGQWASEAAGVVSKIVNFTTEEREAVVKLGIENAKRFDTEKALDMIESIYQRIIDSRGTN